MCQQGRITAKRLLPVARAEGYDGSDRNFRRLVADAKADYRRYVMPVRPLTFAFRGLHYGRYGSGGEDSRLVENIDDSLKAIEEILGALLDISRLDAGAMTPSISMKRCARS